jgi:peptidoglycan/xylan/chitin deacetylase (PgdA/CDA1 family)
MAEGDDYFIPPMAIARPTFERLLEKLARNFRILGMDEAVAALQGDVLPKRSLAITFDDGYYDNFILAQDFLLRKGIPATFFLPVRQIDSGAPYWWDYLKAVVEQQNAKFWKWLANVSTPFIPVWPKNSECPTAKEVNNCCRQLVRALNGVTCNERKIFLASIENEFGRYRGEKLLMTWADARMLCRQGFNVCSHTLSHEPLTDLSDAEAFTEIEQSREVLAQRLGRPINGFCYPRGAHSVFLAEAVKRTGYKYAVTTRYGANFSDADIFTLRRRNMADFQGIRANFPVLAHRLELTSLFDHYLSARRSG